MVKKLSLFLVPFLSIFSAFSQITVDGTGQNNDATYLIEDILIDAGALGLDVSNITYSEGDTNQIGYFSNGAANIGMEDGVVMSTGGLDFLTTIPGGNGFYAGPGNTDSDLKIQMDLVGMDTNTSSLFNVIVIEFDFEAVGNSIEFNYVFASQEYPQYVCSQFNDIFGFFISGPGITGPFSNSGKNIALVPDPANPTQFTTTPVTINTINIGEGGGGPLDTLDCYNIDPDWEDYSVFFVENFPVVGINQRGHTTVLTAASEVVCGETYHMKLAIADVGDGSFNSSVFLEAGSFNVVSASTNQSSEFQFSDSIIIEGCYIGVLEIELDSYSDINSTEFVLGVGGTATEGVDFLEIPDTVQVPPGDSTFQIFITPIVDNLIEGDETVIIYILACDDTVSAIEFVIQDPDPIIIELSGNDTTICQNHPEPIQVEAFASGGYVPYTYTWYYEGVLEFSNTSSVLIPSYKVGLHIVEVEGDCGYTYTDTFEIIHFPHTAEVEYTSVFNLETTQIVEGCEYLTLNITLSSVSENDTTLYIDIVGGDAVEGEDFYPIPRAIHFSPGQLTASISIEALVDGVFEDDETIEIFYNFYDECSTGPNPEVITIISNPLLNTAIDELMELCQGEEFVLSAEAIGGIEPYIYTWKKDQAVWSGNDVSLVAEDSAIYYLTLRDACGYETIDSVFVSVPEYAALRVESDLQKELTICVDDALPLEIEVEGGSGDYTYKWSLDGIPVSYEEEYIVQNMDVSNNSYSVVVTDHCGSSSTRSFNVIVEHCKIPNVMTPNGDGINDYFLVDFREAVSKVQMHIYDRWGKLVFQSNNYELCSLSASDFCWDGVNQNSGNDCEEGVYFYLIEFPDGRDFKGTFSLMK